MSDYERSRLALIEQVAPFVGEPITDIGVVYRSGRPRLLGRRVGPINVLAVTPTRIVLIRGAHGPPLVRCKAVIGAWPRTAVTVATESFVDHQLMNSTGNTHSTRKTRVTLTFADATAPLTVELLNRAAISYGVLKALEPGRMS